MYTGNFNSSANQMIKDELVKREVMACISDMAKYLFSWEGNKLGTWDEWENLYDEDTEEYREIYEYWIVTSWFADKLAEHGEPVFRRYGGGDIWGRCCTGQSISLDSVIDEIAEEMEILEGQSNFWKKEN